MEANRADLKGEEMKLSALDKTASEIARDPEMLRALAKAFDRSASATRKTLTKHALRGVALDLYWVAELLEDQKKQ
jgi:hypothetical protein